MHRLNSRTLSCVLCIGVLVGSLTGPVYGSTSTWVLDPSTVGDWEDPNNWTPQPPGFSDIALIDNGGTASIAQPASLLELRAGFSYAGSVVQMGDYVSATDVYLGYEQGATGTFSQTAGTTAVGGTLCLGHNPGSGGTYELSLGSLGSAYQYVGWGGTGSFVQQGGTNIVGTEFMLGRNTGSAGTYGLSGGSLDSPTAYVGLSGEGAFSQSGGSSAVGGSLSLGYDVASMGTYTLSEGWLDVGGREDIGVYGTGTFHQSGGTNAASSIRLGYHTGSSGTYNLSGGSLLTAGSEDVGYYGTGSVVQSGGTHVVAVRLDLGSYAAGRGSYHLSDGLLEVGGSVRVASGTSARGTLNVTAGSLTAGGPIVLATGSSSTGLLKASKVAYVQVGGLILNTGSARSSTIGVELALSGHTTIYTTAASTLGGVIDVQSLSGFRPREGDKFAVISSTDPNDVHFVGNFSTFTSNITLGLPDTSAFGGAANGANYELTFLGYTYGDANGDHKVNGGDLALVGGSWMQSGQSWGTFDFSGEGVVNGGDLALMGGNWMWSLPAGAPVTIPEPGSAALLVLGASAALHRAWRRGAA